MFHPARAEMAGPPSTLSTTSSARLEAQSNELVSLDFIFQLSTLFFLEFGLRGIK